MSNTESKKLILTEDYLDGELVATVKHEYVAGVVFGRTDTTNQHNLIAGNVFLSLGTQLNGKLCRPYNSDTKIRIRSANHTRFYYPDVSVICQPNPPTDTF